MELRMCVLHFFMVKLYSEQMRYRKVKIKQNLPVLTSSRVRALKWRNCMTCIFKEKGTYLGRVEDPTTAKFAPFVNVDPDKASRYGVKKLTFKLWPANF